MPGEYIILSPVEKKSGSGVVSFCDFGVSVSVDGVCGKFLVMFLSDDKEIAKGRIKGGESRCFNLSQEEMNKIDKVLLYSEGKVVMMGAKNAEKRPLPQKKTPFNFIKDYEWERIDGFVLPEDLPIVRFAFGSEDVFWEISKAGHYYYGKKGLRSIIAIEGKGRNPFSHIEKCARKIENFWVLGINKRDNYFFSVGD